MEFSGAMRSVDMNYPPLPADTSIWENLKHKLFSSIMISERHPGTIEYFKSEVAVLREKKRHYENFKYTIHPLSKFNQFYETWCFFLYGILVYFKTFDFAFVRISRIAPFDSFQEISIMSVILDVVSLVNIFFQFHIGYTVKSTRYIELSRSRIMLRYLTNGHFFCDLFSSIPRVITWKANATIFLITVTLSLLKLRRLTTFIKLIKPTALFFGIKSRTKIFLFGFFFIVALTTHVMTCFHFGITRYRIAIQEMSTEDSYVNTFVFKLPAVKQYMITFFRSAQSTFLVEMPHFRAPGVPEELFFTLINYIVGKTLISLIWIVLLYTLTSKRVLKTKFEGMMTELNDYMLSKQLPLDLKERLISYYNYKYQKVFFNEVLIRTILSDNLKREIDLFLCKSLIKQVTIFSLIEPRTVKRIIEHLVPQIYLPSDLIIQSGTYGDCMYFIESGTVAVMSPSGKEVCHLHDGAYFGEVSILFKNQKRTASIVAIEYTRIFQLSKEQFDNNLKNNKKVCSILLESAKKRIERTQDIEIEYKKDLFGKEFGSPSVDHEKS